MAVITYTAIDRGFLKPGNVEFNVYDIEFCVSEYDTKMDNTSTTTPSINGNIETLFQRVEKSLTLTATFLTSAQLVDFEEFISSVGSGEFFFVDPLGTIAVPSAQTFGNVYLKSKSFSFTRSTTPGVNERFDIMLNMVIR